MNSYSSARVMCSRSAAITLALAAFLVACPVTLRAASRTQPDRTSPSLALADSTQDALRAVNERLATSDWPGALAVVDRLLRTTTFGSYDHAMAHLHRVQALLSRSDPAQGDHAAAIASLEHVMQSGYWPRPAMLEWHYVLAQLYTHARRFDDAERELETWLAETSAPTPQAYTLLVTGTLERAQEDPTHVDPARLEHALARANEGLRLGVRPDETLLYLKAACLQALQRWDDAAETLEFLLHQNPAHGEHWGQLLALYAAGGRDLPAILTIERARQHGALDSARTDVALGQFYHALDQDRKAIDAIEAGLRKGVEDPASHGIFAAFLAYRANDLPRASRLLAAAEPHVTNEGQRRDVANLRAAIAGGAP